MRQLGCFRNCEERSDLGIDQCPGCVDCFASLAMTAVLASAVFGETVLKMSVIDLAASPSDLRSLAEQSSAWPFEQAKAIVARLKKRPKDEVLFETGYGPSGLPHIGTFGEVART